MATQYYVASSIDGFIADDEETLSWLLTRHADEDGPMAYRAFIADVGALVMGAATYRWVLNHDSGPDQPPWPYDIPAWVFTHHDLPRVDGDVRFVSGPVADVYPDMLSAAGDRNTWVVGGGDLAGQFADEGLLDEVWVTYAPVTLGSGAPLLPRRLELELQEVARSQDFACARFRVVH